MYQSYYQFSKRLDRQNIPVEEMFLGPAFHEALSRLEFMKSNRGITLVTGRPGVGKTTLVRYFVHKLNPNYYKVAYAPLSTVSPLQFYQQVAYLLSGQKAYSKPELFRLIQENIMELAVNRNTVPVIIFDEAHLLNTQNFFELQLLSNFDFDSVSPVLFILISQPHLADRLAAPIFDAFYQRIRLHIPILPFSREQTRSFISHIMKNASSSIDLFTPKAINLVFDISQGICRKITRIVEQAFIFGAAHKREQIDEEVIYQVSTEIDIRSRGRKTGRVKEDISVGAVEFNSLDIVQEASGEEENKV